MVESMYKYYAVLGMCFMIINNIALASLDICAKILTQSITPAQIVFAYKLILFIITLPWVLFKGLQLLKTSEIKIHFLRSFFSVLGGICFYKGLENIKVADAAALENLQYIILAIIGMAFFNEGWSKTKIISIMLGFIGAIIIVNPQLFTSSEYKLNINSYYVYTILAIIFWSMNSVTVKLLGRTEKNRTQLFYLLLFALMWSLPGAILKFDDVYLYGVKLPIIPSGLIDFSAFNLKWVHLKYIVIMALFYFVHSLAYFNALKRDISVVAPFRYSKLIFSGIAGYMVFGEVPNNMQYLGYLLIMLSGFMLIRREVKNMKRARS